MLVVMQLLKLAIFCWCNTVVPVLQWKFLLSLFKKNNVILSINKLHIKSEVLSQHLCKLFYKFYNVNVFNIDINIILARIWSTQRNQQKYDQITLLK